MKELYVQFAAVAQKFQRFRCQLEPTWAHLIGEYAWADQFEDVSRPAQEAAASRASWFATVAAERVIPDPAHALDWRLLEWEARHRGAVLALRLADFEVDPLFGPVASIPVNLPKQPLPTRDVAAMLPAKLLSIAQHFRDRVERLRVGIAEGRVAPRFAVDGTIELVERWLAAPLSVDPLLSLPDTSPDTDRDRLMTQLTRIVRDSVRPALAAYAECLRHDVAPAARPDDRCGLGWLPDGDTAYATLARWYTSTDLAPEELHRIGLEQVEGLREEYAVTGQQAMDESDPQRVMAALRDDPALHFESPADVVSAAEAALTKATRAAPTAFRRLPRAQCSVEPATAGSLAYYFRPPKDGSRGGICFINLSDPRAWARYEIEALMYHEGVPGHHLQIGLAGELDHLADFRRTARITSYAEGWGLYAERLADEMGLYSRPIDRLGMLSFDSLRACRLVVDTGIHALGWSRERAWQFLTDNSPLSPSHVRAEVDRYIVTPAQALAYMVGRLEIMRIRTETQDRLGSRFDLSAFHDAVLGEGQLPLPLLREHVRTTLS